MIGPQQADGGADARLHVSTVPGYWVSVRRGVRILLFCTDVHFGAMAEIGVTEARDQLGELVNRAAYSDERIILTRHGRAVAALVPLAVLHDLEAAEDAADLAAARAAATESGPNVPHSQVLGDLVADEAQASRSA